MSLENSVGQYLAHASAPVDEVILNDEKPF